VTSVSPNGDEQIRHSITMVERERENSNE